MKTLFKRLVACALVALAALSHAETTKPTKPPAAQVPPSAPDPAGPPVSPQAAKFLGKRLHLQTNVWYENPDQIFSTTYHMGSILPVGTEVMITEITDKALKFNLTESKASFTMLNVNRANQNMTTDELADLFFSEADPLKGNTAFHGFTEEEKKNVRLGKIEPGMRREAVIMAYGHPPRQTPEPMNDNVWIYWDNPEMKRIVLFENDRVIKVVESK